MSVTVLRPSTRILYPSQRGIRVTQPGGGAAAIPWFLAGGIAAANCIAAYTPKGAASLAASYDNNAAPGNGLADGTYDGTTATAPTWDTVSGWKFVGTSSQYLDTGVVPASGFSMLIRFSDRTDFGWVTGVYKAASNNRFSFGQTNFDTIEYGSGKTTTTAPGVTSGVFGVAGQQGYRNGVADGETIAAWNDTISDTIWIAHLNGYIGYLSVYIQALAIYNTVISGTQVGLVTTAMAAR